MPRRLKIRAAGTDAWAMSDTAVTPTNPTASPATSNGMLLDGEAPRLGSAPIIPPAPMGGAGTPTTTDPGTATPSASVISPVLSSEESPMHADEPRFATNAPVISEAEMPTLPTAAPTAPTAPTPTDTDAVPAEDAEPQHPMAHLMPSKSKPTEASIRAAEQRAIKKAKAKKIKIGVVVGALVVSALAGPPLVSWLTNAINESGSLNTDEPAD
jgi:hypothetical protein